MTKVKKPNDLVKAAENMDWRQVVSNGGPPCFHLCKDGCFCGRTDKWAGHCDDVSHRFISFAELLSGLMITRDEREALLSDKLT